ncbi:MAG: hypothetical protein ACI906_003082 [Candidatus Latescibacterota bacterium]|jgi:hypothetical protein
MKGRALFLLLLFPLSSAAVEQLVIGRNGLSFVTAQSTSTRLMVTDDSLWIWNTTQGTNIAPLVLRRGGRIFPIVWQENLQGSPSPTLPAAAGIDRMVDGDELTAFSPAAAGLKNQMDLYLDLGSHYGVEQIRFFPRLDAEHSDRYLQAFQLGSDRRDPSEIESTIFEVCCGSPNLINAHINAPNTQSVVIWPHPNTPHDPRPMRHVRIRTLNERPWEIAEIEIISDGSAPPGEYTSKPMEVRNARPVWGRLLVNGRDPGELPISIETRTGPDVDPIQYFLRQGFDRVKTTETQWTTAFEGLKLPPQPNPFWSPWQTLSEGLVVSPPQSAIQFRLRLLEPGTHIDQLLFEFTSRPLAQDLSAEINPIETAPGELTPFILDLRARRLEDLGGSDSGFRFIEVRTSAEIEAIDSVYVQDRPVFYSSERTANEGFTLRLTERIKPQGSFVQIFFRARIFSDGTRFNVRALDRRPTIDGEEEVYQTARAADIDPRTPGGTLSVRLSSRKEPLIDGLAARTSSFTPNGDGANDYFTLSYNLLRLTQPAPAFFEIYDLSGRLVRRGYAGQDLSGSHLRLWDGFGFDGGRVLPGIYLYRIRLEADAKKTARQGLVHVIY